MAAVFDKIDRSVISARRQLDDNDKAGTTLHATLAATLDEANTILISSNAPGDSGSLS